MKKTFEGTSLFGSSQPATERASQVAEDLLRRLHRKITADYPEWDKVSPGDPQRVLVEVFAEALAEIETLACGLEDRLYPRVLEALGAARRWPVAATGVVQFVKDPGTPGAVRVPCGTVVSAPRSAGGPHVTFDTQHDVWASDARLLRVTGSTGEQLSEWLPYPASGWDAPSRPLFESRCRPLRFLYLGDPLFSALRSPLGELVLAWSPEAELLIEAQWEYSLRDGWRTLRTEWEQAVSGGEPVLHLRLRGSYPDLAETEVDYQRACWLRCALPGSPKRLSLPTPYCVSSSARPPQSATQELRTVFRLPRPITSVHTRHEDTWQDHSFAARTSGATTKSHRFEVANSAPEWEPAVYLGWGEAASGSVYWDMECSGPFACRTTSEPLSAPTIVWEVSSGEDGFTPLSVTDLTQGFTRSGCIDWEAPSDWSPRELHGERLYWIRARWTDGSYAQPPKLAAVIPHAARIRQGSEICDSLQEVTFDAQGRGVFTFADGDPEMLALLQVKSDHDDWLTLVAETSDVESAQEPNNDSATSDREDDEEHVNDALGTFRVQRVTPGTVEVVLGPEWAGTQVIRFPCLRFVHGEAGNLPSGAIQLLESEVTGVSPPVQPLPTSGGCSEESAEAYRRRVLSEWRTRSCLTTVEAIRARAVALEPQIARMEVQEDPARVGRLTATVVPRDPCRPGRFLPPRLCALRDELVDEMPLGTVLDVVEAVYLPVDVVARCQHNAVLPPHAVRSVLLERLKNFFHPLTGGAERRGFPSVHWLATGDFNALLQDLWSNSDRPRSASPAVVGEWDLSGWTFELSVPSGAPPDSWLRSGVAVPPVVFPSLDRLLFLGENDAPA